jgi:cyclohexadienyl dehydratase
MWSRNSALGCPSERKFQVFVLARLFAPSHNWAQRIVIYAIMFSLFLGVLGCDQTATTPESSALIAPRVTLRVAISGDYEPFSHWAQGESEPTGFSVEIARAYAVERSADLHWVRFRWPELAADLDAGSFDIALSGITVRPDRSAKGRFSLPLTTSGAVLLMRTESTFNRALDLDQPTVQIAVNAGGHLERVAQRLFSAATIRPIADNASVLEELTQGRVDAVLTDSLEAPHWLRIAKSSLRASAPLTRDRKAAWFPAGSSDEAERFNRWLLRAEASGQLERIREQFELPQGRTASALPALLSSLDERLTLMTAVADAKHVLGVATENAQREEVVLNAAVLGVLGAAKDAGIKAPDAAAIRRLFQTQIEAAKWIQERRREALRSAASPVHSMTKQAARTELEAVIRPALIYLGDRISMLLVANIEGSGQSFGSSAPALSLTLPDVSEALERHDLPYDRLQAIYQALAVVLRSEG